LVFGATREENVLLKSNIIREIGSGYLVGRSRAMKHVYKSVEDTAPTDLPVLILGETGTGKGMIARLIHLKSRRRDKRFLPINCGTIPETLLESELFGHKKGSFTGAVSDKRGLLEEAGGGTVFLDEITNTSLSFQAKLLEAIEEKTIRRVGETVTRKIDVRFLFATNRDLEIEVEEGRFRKDLFYRINVFEGEIPPLRDRRNDIPQLAQLFLDRFRREINKKIDGFTAEALDRLKNNFWPGNVRELQNVIERSVIQAKSRLITAEDIGDRNPSTTEGKTIKLIKKEAILEELKTTNGNTQKAAKNLGINRRTIQRYIKQYKIQS
jgi:transcriptional regulator with GAF, ATPase, and Fis domain